MPVHPEGRHYYGWWIVAACLVNMTITSGITNIAFPVFLVPLTEHFGWSRSAVAGGISMMLLALGLSAPLAGRLAGRYGPRQIMLPGAVLAGLCLWSCAGITALWQLYVIRFCAGIAFALMAHVPVTILLSRWFSTLRGRATGLALIGAPIGGLTFTPVASLLVENFGWRSALLVLGAMVWLVLLPLVYLVIKDSPPAPPGTDKAAKSAAHEAGMAIEEIVKSRKFRIILVLLLFQFTGIFSLMVHQLPHFIDSGKTPTEAALLVSLVMLCSVLGGAGCGWASDRFNVYRLFALCSVAMLLGVMALAKGMIYFYIPLFGLGFGGSTPLMAMLAGKAFGMRSYGNVYSYFQMTICLSGFAGPTLMGLSYDLAGGYETGFACLIAAWTICAVASLVLSRGSFADSGLNSSA